MDNHRGSLQWTTTVSRRCRCWNPVTGCTKILPVARPPCLSRQWTTTGGCPDVGVPTMSLLESSHRMHQNIRRLQGLRACPDEWTTTGGCPDVGVPTMSLLESSHRMHQNICRLQGLRACPYNGQPQGVVPTWVPRRCRCWNPITGCTKISAGCKAPVPVPIMDNHRGLSRRGCPDDVF